MSLLTPVGTVPRCPSGSWGRIVKREVGRHTFRSDNGQQYVVVESEHELIAKGLHGTRRGKGTSSFKLSDGRELIEIDGDDEPNAFEIAATGEVIRRV